MKEIPQREKLRTEIKKRIAAGLITQTQLSIDSGVRQATISRFVSDKADISWPSAIALMAALDIRTEDLAVSHAAFDQPSKGQAVPLVKQVTAAITPIIASNQVEQWTDITIPSLGDLPVTVTRDRASWTRFVAIDATEDQIGFMHPVFKPNTRFVIDRHQQQPLVYYQRRRAMYLIAGESPLRVGYLQLTGNKLKILRFAIGTQSIHPSDIVGRICEVITRARY